MSTEESASTRAGKLITDEWVKKVNAVQVMEAELALLTDRLHRAGDLKAQLELRKGEKPTAYVQRLMKRRAELLSALRTERAARQRAAPLMLRLHPPSLDPRIQLDWGKYIQPVAETGVPAMTEGISTTPGVAGTHGEIATLGLYDGGGVAFGGTPEDDGQTDPYTAKWWVHNWRCVVEFPPAPAPSSLAYWFGVSCETHIYLAPVYSGTVRAFVTIGDSAGPPITNWDTVGWPVNVVLPQSGILSFTGEVPVSGAIALGAGQIGVVGMIYGVIVSAASGYVQFSWGNFGTHRPVPSGQSLGAGDYGLMAYRF